MHVITIFSVSQDYRLEGGLRVQWPASAQVPLQVALPPRPPTYLPTFLPSTAPVCGSVRATLPVWDAGGVRCGSIQARDRKPCLDVWELQKDPGRRELSGEAPALSLGPRVWFIPHLCPTTLPSASLPNKPACPDLSPGPRTSPAFQLLLAKEGPQIFFRVAVPQPLWRQTNGQADGTCLEPSLGPWLRVGARTNLLAVLEYGEGPSRGDKVHAPQSCPFLLRK